MVFGEKRETKALDRYLKEARHYLESRGSVNPASEEIYKIAEELMQRDGIDLSKIRRGEQEIPRDNL